MKSLTVRGARTEAKMTQSQSASALGISRKTYAKYEKGETMPTIDMAYKIANLFGFKLDEIRFRQK